MQGLSTGDRVQLIRAATEAAQVALCSHDTQQQGVELIDLALTLVREAVSSSPNREPLL